MFVVFAGLPGVGKSVLSRAVADTLGATYVRVDSIEAAIVTHLVPFENNPVGYFVAGAVASDQLRSGRDVVLDAVNDVEASRQGWVDLGGSFDSPPRFVEVVCTDADEHRRRVEGRSGEMPGHVVPTWEQVQRRDYEPWRHERLVVDNLGSPEPHVARILAWLGS
jgi:predicted kinase